MSTVPCAARASPMCVETIPLGSVAARDVDAAAICGPCADELEFTRRLHTQLFSGRYSRPPMARKLTSDNGTTRDAAPDDLEDDVDEPTLDQDEDDQETERDVSLTFHEYLIDQVPSAEEVRDA